MRRRILRPNAHVSIILSSLISPVGLIRKASGSRTRIAVDEFQIGSCHVEVDSEEMCQVDDNHVPSQEVQFIALRIDPYRD